MSHRPHHPAFPESKWSFKAKTGDKLRYKPCPCCKSADCGMQMLYPVAITSKILDRCNAVQSPDPNLHLGTMPRAIMLHVHRSSLRCSWPQLCQIYSRCAMSRSVLSSSTQQKLRHAFCTNVLQSLKPSRQWEEREGRLAHLTNIIQGQAVVLDLTTASRHHRNWVRIDSV